MQGNSVLGAARVEVSLFWAVAFGLLVTAATVAQIVLAARRRGSSSTFLEATVGVAHPLSGFAALRLSFLSSAICSARIRASSWTTSPSRVSSRAFRKRLAR